MRINCILIFSFLFCFISNVAAQSENDMMPLVREGVKWVNEKVIINHGDTTSYYYTYEIFGEDIRASNDLGLFNHACYYYTGENLDVEKDSIISGLSEEIFDGFSEVTSSCNNAYSKAIEEDRQFIPLIGYAISGNKILYRFGGQQDYNRTLAYYFYCSNILTEYLSEMGLDNTDILTEENFFEADSFEIDGCVCVRCAYVNETGDTLAYVVEGIGFDSRDMGDLLTPFMTPPDPNADYQEYWGLSHVIKDGQIIYKGMRYRESIETGINEVVADKSDRMVDGNYYNLMGQPVGKELPQTPGIYIHNGKKIIVK